MTKSGGPDQTERPVDPGELPVGQVLRQYPLAKLLGMVVALLAGGFGAGYWLRDKLSSEELRHCNAEFRTLEKQAGILQQAINSGQCVKSEFLAQQDEARRLLGRLEIANRAIEHLRQGVLSAQRSPDVFLLHDYWTSIDLGRFLDDPKVTELISEMSEITIDLNDKLPATLRLAQTLKELRNTNRTRVAQGQPPMDISRQESDVAETNKRFEQLQAALVRTREYLKSKYVMPIGTPER